MSESVIVCMCGYNSVCEREYDVRCESKMELFLKRPLIFSLSQRHADWKYTLILTYPLLLIYKFVFLNSFRKSQPEEKTLDADRGAGGKNTHEAVHFILYCPRKMGL